MRNIVQGGIVMSNLKFEFGDDVKEYLKYEVSDTLTIIREPQQSEYAVQCEFITSTTPPKEGDGDFEKFVQDGITFHVSKKNIDLSEVSAIKLKVSEYESDLAGRNIDVELVK
ncbi:hypothetical protein EUAN_14540 [Andreesenia angusta]|uniref:Uncharacterized protein n=2 Tax=Andreesenia angusta TaxID=39480 RepID=A0A1S1V5T8_9FIRM|nr:hypothetical protein EUAN_14540 [Andreesenia angusta]